MQRTSHDTSLLRSRARRRASTMLIRCVWLVLWHCSSEHALAQAVNVKERVLATGAEVDDATQGYKFGGSAGVFFRSPSDRVGFSFTGDLTYSLRLGPVMVAPGARISGYFAKDFKAMGGFGTLTSALCLGPVLPFVMGGVGVGYIGGDYKDVGVGYLGGGGLLLVLGRRLILGVEATYQGFALTDFHALFLGGLARASY